MSIEPHIDLPNDGRAATLATDATVWRDLLVLSKSGIATMVVVSTAAGMLLAASGSLPWTLWLGALLGTGLLAAGSGALNQVLEREVDARMRRTANRPLPSGRIAIEWAALLGVAWSMIGLALLAVTTNPAATVLGLLTSLGYLFVYTPLKARTAFATVVGAVPGAMPPLIGWAAVEGRLGAGGWALFALLFFWQLPHFLSIAWIYRADYARGGFPLITQRDPDGSITARQATLYCAALVPVSLLPRALGLTGDLYFVGTLLLGLVFLAMCGRFAMERTHQRALRLMLTSVFYLPAVLTVLALDRLLF